MKKVSILVLAFAWFFTSQSNAQSLISVENPSTGSSFYKFLDQAINNAQAGDIIHVPGGSFSMGTVHINKPLSIIGVGHHPDSTLATNQTIITGNIPIDEGASNLYLEGFYLTGSISLTPQDQAHSVVIKRCNVAVITSNGSHFSQFQNDSTFSDSWQISHNVIRGDLEMGNFRNFTLTGNIITSRMFNVFFGGIIENNIFLYNSQSEHLFDNVRNSTFKNNIFLHSWELSYPAYACYNPPCGSYENTFLNNSFCMGGQNLYLENGVAAVSMNNKFDADPSAIFQNVTGNTFNYSFNYHIIPSFTSQIIGTDALELGIYGSSNPYKEGAVPLNPHIQSKTIAPSTTPNGMLNVNIKVAAQNN